MATAEIDEQYKDGEGDDVLATARKRFSLAQESENEIRKEAIDDLKFRKGDQWPLDIKNQRNQDRRPCLTINRLPQQLRQITNDQRQNRPSIKVNPVDNEATVETAEVLEGMIRHIEYSSNADVAYDTAFDGTATHGFGYFRVVTDYVSPYSFDQEIRIKRIKDPFTVYLDPFIQEPDGSDAEWGFVFEEMSKEEFKSKYKDSKLSLMQNWESLGDELSDWVTKAGCRVAEYFYKEYETKKVFLLSDESVVPEDEMPKQLPEGISIVQERQTLITKIKWCKTNGLEILEKTDWLGTYIPIIPVYGDEILIEGKRTLEGVIRHAKDPQRMYNYWASSETEAITLAPKSPFVGAAGQFEGYEQFWKTANTKNHPYLPYNPKDINGTPLPPPERQSIEPAVMAITQAKMQAAEEIKATTGIYDPTIGNRQGDQSGVAIQRLNTQAQTSNFHLIDNLGRSIRHAGRIIVELLPKIYTEPQAVMILKEDGTKDKVVINQMFEHGGKQVIHDLDLGRYDVTVATGPSYQTKRQEALASMIDMSKAMPGSMASAMDLVVQNMDWPGAQEVAERIRKTLPPQLIDNKDDMPPQAQAVIGQFRQQNQALIQQLNQLTQVVETKKLELESKERIALKRMETDLAREQMKIDATHSRQMFVSEVDHIHKRLDLIGDNQDILNNINGAGPQAAAPPNQNQPPTAGSSAGQNMGAQ